MSVTIMATSSGLAATSRRSVPASTRSTPLRVKLASPRSVSPRSPSLRIVAVVASRFSAVWLKTSWNFCGSKASSYCLKVSLSSSMTSSMRVGSLPRTTSPGSM